MSRWMHYEEDAYRLPEGFTRIGYDADSRRYIFKDKQGSIYQSEPEADYGTLVPVAQTVSTFESVRPRAFAASNSESPPMVSPLAEDPTPKTFQDILPPELITSSTLSEHSRPSRTMKPKTDRGKSKESVGRSSAYPIMQNVVSNLRRSVTSMRKRAYTQPVFSAKRESYREEDTERLVHNESADDINLPRMSVSTVRTDGIQDMA